jgi:NADH-quinone oxidoreductase subunit N
VAALGLRATLFYSTYTVDGISQGFKLLIALGLFIVLFLSRESNAIPPHRKLEYYLFLWTGSLGMMMLTSAANLLTLYISLELSSYSLYLLSAVRQDHKNAEAGMKYLVFGAATSGFLL